MKHKEKALFVFILIALLSIIFSAQTSVRKTRFSSSTRFLVHFLRGLGIRVNSRGLAILIRRKCKKFSNSPFVKRLSRRIRRLGKGLKKINSLKSGSSSKKRRFFIRLARVHVVSLFRQVFKGLRSCSVIPTMTRSYIKKSIKTMKRIMWGRCRSKKARRGCRVFSSGRVSRVFGRLRALLRLSNRKMRFSRKSSKKNHKRRSVKHRRSKRRSKGRKNKKSRSSSTSNLTGREAFYYIANSFSRLLRRFIKRLGSKHYKKWRKSIKKTSKKLRKVVKKILKKLKKKNKGKKGKGKGKPKFAMALIEQKEAVPIQTAATNHTNPQKTQPVSKVQNQVTPAVKA